jgi:inner membrane protein
MIMGALTLALLVPITLVYSTVRERASRRDTAVAEISGTWGGPQTLAGPVLTVPYVYSATDHNGGRREVTAFAHLLPRDLDVTGVLDTERRRRGIFDVVVYRAELTVRGRFRPGALDWMKPAPERIDWPAATLSVGVSDPRGLNRRTVLTWRNREVPFEGSVPPVGLFASGIHARVGEPTAPAADAEIPFSFNLSVNGTRDIRFLPAADETIVALRASWLHPSFTGAPLPEQWEAAGQGFSARWRVPDFGRTYPPRWVGHDTNPEQLAPRAAASAFGVALIQPVDIYHQAERAVKYAALFIVLTFLMFFLWEILQATLLHPVQYAFVGFSLCVFYLLLVSISEHFGFTVAYAASSTSIVLLVGGYARAVLRGRRQALSVSAALTTLYGFLYLLLQLEDFALLAGSVGLLLILAGLMYATRRMDWYGLRLGGAGADVQAEQ